MKQISSIHNPLVKEWSLLHDGKERKEKRLFLIEGYHLVEEAHKAGCLREVLITKVSDEVAGVDNILVTPEIIGKLVKTKTPQGIIGICSMNEALSLSKNRYLVLDGVQDPGNVGTLLRSALGFGIQGVILSPTCADVYHDKVIRSTQGALFHLDLYMGELTPYIAALKERNIPILGTDVSKGTLVTELKPTSSFALILGSEAQGMSPVVSAQVDELIHIKTSSQLESLNVAIAGSIILHHLMVIGGY